MRYWPIFVLAALAGCSSATASKVDTRTFSINGPIVPGGSEGPDARLAEKICPKGYRVINEMSFQGGSTSLSDRGAHADMENPGVATNWTIRCL
jgi:hypothetical protein